MATTKKFAIIPVMLCFFVMGFVDLVGIASNYVKQDLGLSDTVANVLPSLVFFWFLVFSVPTGMLMNRIGRKNTVLISVLCTVVSLLLPLFGNTIPLMIVSFSLLGISNAIIQTSLNPLVTDVMNGGNLAATLTFGQFVKAISSFSAPLIASWGALKLMPDFGYGWRVLFLVFLVIAIVSILLLKMTPIEESAPGKASSFKECFSLLSKPVIFLSFLGIVCHVGIDVGTNITAPKVLVERLSMSLDDAAFATMLYFIFRTLGCLSGSFILRWMNNRLFFVISVLLMAAGMAGLGLATTKTLLYTSIALVGFGNSNVFSLVFSRAIMSDPVKQNEISGLMIMGLIGGSIFPVFMGLASDAMHTQLGAALVMLVGIAYLLYYSAAVKESKESK